MVWNSVKNQQCLSIFLVSKLMYSYNIYIFNWLWSNLKHTVLYSKLTFLRFTMDFDSAYQSMLEISMNSSASMIRASLHISIVSSDPSNICPVWCRLIVHASASCSCPNILFYSPSSLFNQKSDSLETVPSCSSILLKCKNNVLNYFI